MTNATHNIRICNPAHLQLFLGKDVDKNIARLCVKCAAEYRFAKELEPVDNRPVTQDVYQACRCCGKPVPPMDNHPIHTLCMRRHWTHHVNGTNASRCHEFGKR